MLRVFDVLIEVFARLVQIAEPPERDTDAEQRLAGDLVQFMLLVDALRFEQVGQGLAVDAEIGINAAASLEACSDEQVVIDRARQVDAALGIRKRVALRAQAALETATAIVEADRGGGI